MLTLNELQDLAVIKPGFKARYIEEAILSHEVAGVGGDGGNEADRVDSIIDS